MESHKQRVILLGNRLIDGTGRDAIHEAFLVMESDRIVAVGSRRDESWLQWAASDHTTIDMGAGTILPGLINVHEHLDNHWGAGPYQVRARQPITWLLMRSFRNALVALQDGVTTVRDMSSKEGINLTLKKAITKGMIIGPRVVASGQAIAMTGGHGHRRAIEADGPDEARKAARRLLKAGADFIKIMASGGFIDQAKDQPDSPQMNESEMRAAFDEAKKAGKKTTVHAHPPAAIRAAISAGVDCIEHAALVDEETADLMARHRVYLVPTLGESWVIADRGLELGRPAWLVESCRSHLKARMATFRTAVQAGIRMGVGTDVVGSMALEMELMRQGGMSAADVIVAATRNGAEICDLVDQTGTLEAGKLADAIVVEGDPLSDLGAVSRVGLVVKAGRPYRPAELAAATGTWPL